jgi:hypothetical protein
MGREQSTLHLASTEVPAEAGMSWKELEGPRARIEDKTRRISYGCMILPWRTVVSECYGEGFTAKSLFETGNIGKSYNSALIRIGIKEGSVEISGDQADTPEQIEQLKIGTLDLSIAAYSHASQFIPELGIFRAPYLFESDEHFANVFDGEIGTILDKTSLKRYGIRLLTTFTSGNRILFNRKRSVFTPNDLSDLKIRVMDLLEKIRAVK